MTADLLAGVRPPGIWEAVAELSGGVAPVVLLAVAAALGAWPVVLLARRRATRGADGDGGGRVRPAPTIGSRPSRSQGAT